jgi:peptide/nickel transport system substrate-binding protein
VITLKKAENDFLAGLASEYGPKMMSPALLKAHAGSDHDESWIAAHDAGTGPYTVVSANPTTGYVLKYYPGYWGPKPYYTTIDLPVVSNVETQQLELETGKASILLGGMPTRTVSSLRSNKKLAVYDLPTEQGTFVNLNPHAPGLASASVRKAVLAAIDPKTVNSVVYPDGAAAAYDDVYPPHQFAAGVAPQKTSYDPSLLPKEASALSGKTITIAYETGAPNDQQTADLIQTELASGGVHAQVISVTAAQFFATVGKVTDSPSLEVSDPWPDASNPYTWAHIAYDPSGGLSYFQCPDPTAQAALAKAVAVPELSKAQSAYVTAGEDYASTYCWDWLNSQNDVMIAQAGMAGMAQAHNVMAPMTLFFRYLHPIGA